MKNIAMIISYDGTGFSGFQRMPGRRTVQNSLEEKLSVILQQPVMINGSGRTDAGVHALGQVVNFRINDLQIPLEKITLLLNRFFDGEITVRKTALMPEDFHSRFSALRKTYVYWVRNDEKDPWLRNYCWFWKKREWNIEILKEVTGLFVGKHNFSGYSIRLEPRTCPEREIYRLEVHEKKQGILLIFEGNGFLRGMVRVIVSAVLHAASGYLSTENLKEQLVNPGKVILPAKAPPGGLYLAGVTYENWKSEDKNEYFCSKAI